MNFRNIKLVAIAVLLIFASLLFISYQSSTDDLRRDLLVKVVSFAINSGHYHPGDIDDDFSVKAYNLYVERIDYAKRFLLKEDVEKLSKYKTELDDEMKNNDFEFFDISVSILNKRINESESYYKEALEKPFYFEKDEYYEFDPDKKYYAANKTELKERWRKSLKYETLTRLNDLIEEQEKAVEKSDTVQEKSFAELEGEAREKVLKRYDDWFHRMSKLDETDRLNIYINSLVNVFDPHTQYFPPKDKENFDIRFSGQLEGIGAQLTQKNAYIEVIKIIPGSPSWKQGELEVGDYILKVAQGDEEPVDVVDMRLDEAVLLIRGKKGTEARLTIKKLDGAIKEISIIRDVVVLEETYAKSAVIRDDESNRIFGYVKLPSFYIDFNKINGKNCFDDVKNEIEKLKQENVDGIIFDLRNNGGGSLEDVVKIAGLFIEEGPIVQSRGRKGMKKTYKDLDPEIQYGGPLIVMVNAISASASEIFAAAMQDYNRAIVIGGNSTYGKGTVQNFTELDRMVPKKPVDMKPLGALKMTVQKFYRVNGGATQLNGVTPDIVLPDYYNYMDFGERDLDNAMPWSEIFPLTYNKCTPSYDVDYIEEISKKRIKGDSILVLVDENGKRLKKLREDTEYSLNYENYKSRIEKREKSGEKYERIGKDTLGLTIEILKTDLPGVEADTSKKARTEAWITGLKKDVYLVEAVNILNDIDNYRSENARKEK
ncbi:MAG: carboxy terminal-processing peptidase [Bacteroidetes bacterium]|nr:carboxy terminal-processing peptidase [Bacteroidota bacterium]MBL7103159.1 carboxy terminal-processing peptidase [Bacteroidales bacterium]